MKNMPLKQPGLKEQRIGDELYVFSSSGDRLTVLNRQAMMIWSLCDGEHDAAGMATILIEIYPDVERNILQRDIDTCLQNFSNQGLMVGASA
jgi:hypothetical protein